MSQHSATIEHDNDVWLARYTATNLDGNMTVVVMNHHTHLMPHCYITITFIHNNMDIDSSRGNQRKLYEPS